MGAITYRIVNANGIKLNTALCGPVGGNPVILLHGFPDASFGWDLQIQTLAEAGFYVIAPDQRGYNLSDKPTGIANYRLNLLAGDILALADALGLAQFNLAGHDFGAMVSWNLAASHPQRLKRMAILNVPHPKVFNEFLRTDWGQRLRSWYAFFFRLPFLPEVSLRAFNWRTLAGAMSKSLSAADVERYRAAWAQPGAITAMVNWYRAAAFASDQEPLRRMIEVPTLMMWGKLDPYLKWQMAQPSIDLCANGRLEYFEDATHWVHQDRPEEVNQLLIDHFAA